MKIMFSVLGEGRGHMTQAMAVKELVTQAGHHVTNIALGMSRIRETPAFFTAAMDAPIEVMPTLEFSLSGNRKVDLSGTVMGVARRLPNFAQAVRRLDALVREHRPDVIINFFDAVTGLYASTHRKGAPVVAVAHQFMLEHPAYVRSSALRLQQFIMRRLVNLAGAASHRVALSLYPAPDLPQKRITVCPPLLRRQLFSLEADPDGRFVLIYLLNHGYDEQIIAWHRRHPETELHCFYDKPGAPPEAEFDATLTFHRLDGEKFLRYMAKCKYVACTAGFESLSEALFLGKPLFLVPVENHVEQQINGLDARRLGIAVVDNKFNFDRLGELPQRLETAQFRAWLSQAGPILLRTLDAAVQQGRDGDGAST